MIIPVSVKKHNPFTRASALQHGSRNSSPAQDFEFVKLVSPRVFVSGVFFSQTPELHYHFTLMHDL